VTRPLDVLFCDNHLLVVAKPACLPTVPDDSGDTSLLDLAKTWIAREFAKPGAVFLGVVHRLDRPVSGVVLFARTSKAADRLSAQFRERTVSKTYWGLVRGTPRAPAGEVEHWLWKDRQRNRVHIVEEGREASRLAVTRYSVLERRKTGALLELTPRTGRAHQLRVACASLGTPLLGDLKYGADTALEDRSIALHARSLEVEHPTLHTRERWVAEPPSLTVWKG